MSSLLLTIIAIFFVSPTLQSFSFSNHIIPTLAVVWVILALPDHVLHKRTLRVSVLAFCLFFLYFVGFPYIIGNSVVGNRYLSALQIPFLFIAFWSAAQKQRAPKLLWLCVPPLAYSFVQTILALITNPWATRTINTRDAESSGSLFNGTGGYSYIAMWAFVGIVAINFAMQNSRASTFTRWLLVAVTLASISLVVLSNFFTATIIVLTGVVSAILINLPSKRAAVYLVAPTLAMILFAGFSSSLVNILDEGSKTRQRVEQLLSSEGFVSGLMSLEGDRVETRDVSIATIASNPMFGIIVTDYNLLQDDFVKLGQHSFVLDTLALFGIIQGGLFVAFLFIPFLFVRQRCTTRRQHVFNALLAVEFFIFIYNNNITPSIGLVIGVFYPLAVIIQNSSQVALIRRA